MKEPIVIHGPSGMLKKAEWINGKMNLCVLDIFKRSQAFVPWA